MDTGTPVPLAVRATVRTTLSSQLPPRAATTVARVKDIVLMAPSSRPRAKLIPQNEDTRPLSTTSRPGLRPALTTITPPKRDGENSFLRSRSDVGQDRRTIATRPPDRFAPNARDVLNPTRPVGYVMASSNSPEPGPSRLQHRSDRVAEREDRAVIEATARDIPLGDWFEQTKIPGGMSPRSTARTSARKARLRQDCEEQVPEAAQARSPVLTTAMSGEELPPSSQLFSGAEVDHPVDQLLDEITIEPGGEPTAVDEAKKDRRVRG